MTIVEKWAAIAARYSFEHCPIPIAITVRCAQELDGIEIRATAHSRCHDDGAPLRVHQIEIVPDCFAAGMGEADVRETIRRVVRTVWAHEIREFTRFDGAVEDDPHAEEKQRGW